MRGELLRVGINEGALMRGAVMRGRINEGVL